MTTPVWHFHRWRNRLQTVLLILILFGIVGLVSFVSFGFDGMLLALGACVVALLIEPVAGFRLTLSLYRARPIGYNEAPQLWQLLRKLAKRSRLESVPALYYAPSSVINAFAVGNVGNSAIVLNDGLLRTLDAREIAGVLAHEVAHIAHGDLRVMSLADYVSRLTTFLSLAGQLMVLLYLPFLLVGSAEINWLPFLLLILAPWLATLAQSGLSRVREYDADLAAAHLGGDPLGLASALVRIERVGRNWRQWFMPGWGNPDPSWLRSHPPTSERVRRLQEIHLAEADYLDSSETWGWPRSTDYAAPRWRIGGQWW